MFSDPKLWGIVLLSIKVSALAMVFVVPLAIWIGHLLARPSFKGKSILSALVHLPLVLPPVVTGYVLLLVFGRRGFIGQWLDEVGLNFTFSWVGAALAAGIMAFPLVVRPIRLAIETQDLRLQELASTLGAGRWKSFKTITLPLALPGVIAGLVLGFAKALGEFGATITFVSNIPGETQTLSLAIYTLLQSPSGDQAAFALIGISVALSFLAMLGSELVMAAMQRRRGR